jgi:hypothetical protein
MNKREMLALVLYTKKINYFFNIFIIQESTPI